MIKPPLVCLILVCGTVLGLSGIDLILPAVPSIPRTLGGNEVTGQMVIAAFVIGTAISLLVFGNLGSRYSRWHRVIVLYKCCHIAKQLNFVIPINTLAIIVKLKDHYL